MDRSNARDDNLPEVVPDSSPQALSQAELYRQQGFDGGEEKFPSGPGWDGEKYIYTPSPLSPASGGVAALPGRAELGDGDAQHTGSSEPTDRRICGVKKRLFWILISVAVLVVVAVAVGAGVGATRGGNSTSQGQDGVGEGAASSSTSRTTATEATESTAPVTSSPSSSVVSSATSASLSISSSSSSSTSSAAESTPTFLNNQTDGNTYAFQAYSEEFYGGNVSEVIREEGFHDFGFDAQSYIWLNNGTRCCVTFCQGEDDSVGWRCDFRRQPSASDMLNRVNIWCSMDPDGEKEKCSR